MAWAASNAPLAPEAQDSVCCPQETIRIVLPFAAGGPDAGGWPNVPLYRAARSALPAPALDGVGEAESLALVSPSLLPQAARLAASAAAASSAHALVRDSMTVSSW